MCVICVQYEKGQLTLEEALKNFSEIRSTLDTDHEEEVADMLQIEIMKEWIAQNYI